MLLGINALNHDASVCLVNGSEIRFAAHSERYSRRKNDKELHHRLLADCYNYGTPTEIVWFEKPFSKAMRRWYSGETPIFQKVKKHINEHGLGNLPITFVPHHAAHAAMGFYTSKFEDATVIVVDAIGEWDTTSIWQADHKGLKCVFRNTYPNSMGLFYSAATQAIGLKPNEEEYILMGMAAFGKPLYTQLLKDTFFKTWDGPRSKLKHNLHHGMKQWVNVDGVNHTDFAASVQTIFEQYMFSLCAYAQVRLPSKNLIIAGGGALNCAANGKIDDLPNKSFDRIWVPPNPGDAGLSLGAIAYHTKQPINFEHAYLGHEIKKHVDIRSITDYIGNDQVIAVANGRAEFGPRALGNRSILADPRGPNVKDRVNAVKKREQFRPFAPVILAEHADEYFELNHNDYGYMQFAVKCRRPELFPAIVHVDGTSRVQTVNKNSPSIIRPILEAWYAKTGCPMLLNTSMNIKGEPLVNSVWDARIFSNLNKIATF
jgi:carbamoyltransferase